MPARPGTPRYGTRRYGTPRYGTRPYGTPRYGTRQYGTPRYGTCRYGTPRYSTRRCGTPRYGTRWYGTPRYGTCRYGTPRYGTRRYGTPRYGTCRYGTPSYGTRTNPLLAPTRLLPQDMALYDSVRVGEVARRLTDDTGLVRSALGTGTPEGLRSLSTAACGLLLMLAISPTLTGQGMAIDAATGAANGGLPDHLSSIFPCLFLLNSTPLHASSHPQSSHFHFPTPDLPTRPSQHVALTPYPHGLLPVLALVVLVPVAVAVRHYSYAIRVLARDAHAAAATAAAAAEVSRVGTCVGRCVGGSGGRGGTRRTWKGGVVREREQGGAKEDGGLWDDSAGGTACG
ncbi:unnamed protein product [Closterium sp. NIES-54]